MRNYLKGEDGNEMAGVSGIMRNNWDIRLTSFNVRGYKAREPMVHRLMEEFHMDVLTIQETLRCIQVVTMSP